MVKWYLTCLLDVKAEKTQSKINSLRLSALETDEPRTEPSLSACFDCHWVLGLAWPRENSQFVLYGPVIISFNQGSFQDKSGRRYVFICLHVWFSWQKWLDYPHVESSLGK